MEPVSNAWCNFLYRGPREGIGDLPCRRETEHGMPVVRSYFKPSVKELLELQQGGTLCLSIYTEPIPPVSLGVVFTPDDVPAPLIAGEEMKADPLREEPTNTPQA